jgi:hypothetical protein
VLFWHGYEIRIRRLRPKKCGRCITLYVSTHSLSDTVCSFLLCRSNHYFERHDDRRSIIYGVCVWAAIKAIRKETGCLRARLVSSCGGRRPDLYSKLKRSTSGLKTRFEAVILGVEDTHLVQESKIILSQSLPVPQDTCATHFAARKRPISPVAKDLPVVSSRNFPGLDYSMVNYLLPAVRRGSKTVRSNA